MPPPEQPFAVENLRAREYNGDQQVYVLDGARATLDLKSKDLRIYGMMVRFTSEQASGTLTSQKGTLFMEDQPDQGISKNNFLLEGDVYLCENTVKLRAPSVRYFSQGADVAFQSGGDSFEADLATPTGAMHSRGSYFQVNRDYTLIRGFGPGSLSSGAAPTSATALAAPESPAPRADKPATTSTPIRVGGKATPASAKTPLKKPGRQPAQSK